MPITQQAVTRLHNALAPEDVSIYFALFFDDQASVELDVEGYARVAYDGGWLDAKGTRVNATSVAWGAMAADVVVRSVGWFDAASGGVLLGWSRTLTLQGGETVAAVGAGELFSMPAGAVRVVVVG